MTLAEMDALIDATADAAMILLVEGDWRATMRDPAGAAWREDLRDRIVYRGLPVWVACPRAFAGVNGRAGGFRRADRSAPWVT